jgi:hypothetical protein
MTVVAVTDPADREPNPPTRSKMTPSHITALRIRLAFDTVGGDYRRWFRFSKLESGGCGMAGAALDEQLRIELVA